MQLFEFSPFVAIHGHFGHIGLPGYSITEYGNFRNISEGL